MDAVDSSPVSSRQGSLMLGAALVGCGIFPANDAFALMIAAIVAGLVVAGLALALPDGRGSGGNFGSRAYAAGVVVFGTASVLFAMTQILVANQDLGRLKIATILSVTLLPVVVCVVGVLERQWMVAGVAAAAHLVVVVVLAVSVTPRIDVFSLENEAVGHLLTGANPYGATYSSPYTPAEAAQYFSEGFVVDGRIQAGFPYTPVVLYALVVGHFLGDIRVVFALALAFAALAGFRSASNDAGRGAAILILVAPSLQMIIVNGYTEPLSVALMAAVIWALGRSRGTIAAVALAAMLTTKQYFLVAIPLVLLLVPAAQLLKGGLRRAVTATVLAACLLAAPFAVWSPSAIVDSLTAWMAAAPQRADSVAIGSHLLGTSHELSAGFVRALSIGAGLVASVILALCSRKEPWAWAAGTGVVIGATIVTSSNAAANYYFFAATALLLGCASFRESPAVIAKHMNSSEIST